MVLPFRRATSMIDTNFFLSSSVRSGLISPRVTVFLGLYHQTSWNRSLATSSFPPVFVSGIDMKSHWRLTRPKEEDSSVPSMSSR